ncbi:MAG TPA: hypothetical protein P5530_03625 [Candidatus Diapherotrites archaeon]|nr:hypothetical protein [Candidatus Diapherotrites archaeon]
MKKENTKWYFIIAFTLVVGAIIGYLATTNLSTIGNAKANIISTANNMTDYEKFAFDEIENYRVNNNITNALIYRDSTDGKNIPSTIKSYTLNLYTPIFTDTGVVLIENDTGQINEIKAKKCDTITVDVNLPDGSVVATTYHYNKKGNWVVNVNKF